MTKQDRLAALIALAILGGAVCLVLFWIGIMLRGLSFGFY